MSTTAKYAKFMFQLSDLGCSLQVPKLRDTARTLLKLMPAGNYQTLCHINSLKEEWQFYIKSLSLKFGQLHLSLVIKKKF